MKNWKKSTEMAIGQGVLFGPIGLTIFGILSLSYNDIEPGEVSLVPVIVLGCVVGLVYSVLATPIIYRRLGSEKIDVGFAGSGEGKIVAGMSIIIFLLALVCTIQYPESFKPMSHPFVPFIFGGLAYVFLGVMALLIRSYNKGEGK